MTGWGCRSACVIACLALAGCDVLAMPKAKELVANQLRDPSSAQFRDLRRTRQGVVCGEVNGKNGYGGYAGFQRFIAKPDTQEVWLEPTEEPVPDGSIRSVSNASARLEFVVKHMQLCLNP